MNSVRAAYVKLVIKSGYHQKYWQLAEFVVNGTFAEVEVPTNLVSPENGGKFENELSDYTERRGYGVVNLTNGVTKRSAGPASLNLIRKIHRNSSIPSKTENPLCWIML